MRPRRVGPTGVRMTAPVPRTMLPALDRAGVVEQDAADPVSVQGLGKTELAAFEVENFVKADRG